MTETSLLEQLADFAPEQRRAWIAEESRKANLDPAELTRRILTRWRYRARPKQRAPVGDWVFWYLMAGRGFGKEACIETPVPTPYGWTRLGDIKVGDLVFDESGRASVVTETFDRMPDEAWRMFFSDGTFLDVGADHLWVTWDHRARKAYNRSVYETALVPKEWPEWRAQRLCGQGNVLPEETVEEALSLVGSGLSVRRTAARLCVSRQALARHLSAGSYVRRLPVSYDDSPGPRVRTTREIAESLRQGSRDDLNHSIPVCGVLDLPSRSLPLDPYVLGAWLGDGSSNGASFAAALEDQPHWYRALADFDPHPVSDPVLVATYGLFGILRRMGLIRNKHVPPEYLRSSAEQRLALLQGLMDTDGSAAASSVEFTNTNEGLVDAVVELARSLGQKPVVAESRAMLDGRDCGPYWRVTWRPTITAFRMERKQRRVAPPGAQGSRNAHRMIVDCVRIDPKPMRCLTVASRHSMFLLGDAMIPTHNTVSAAQWARERGLEAKRRRIGVIAPTLGDVRATCFEGETGLLSVFPDSELLGGSRSIAWNKSLLELTLANGTMYKGFGTEEPDRLRGPQHHYVWGEEVSSWRDATKGAAVGGQMNTSWSNMTLGLRLGAHPRAVLTSTPKANRLTRDLVELSKTRASYVLVRGSSYENRENLSDVWWQEVVAPLEGTRTGRQEIEAELLEDVEGALWTRAAIDAIRLDAPGPIGWQRDERLRDEWGARMRKIVVGVDPNTTSGESADAAGIIVVGLGENGLGHVLDDRTQVRGGPKAWAAASVDAFHDWKADRIVAESNNGGEMVELTIKGYDSTVPVKLVTASRGKRTRAEPIAALYFSDEEHEKEATIRHVGAFPELEDEMTTWTPADESPNRMDALVWGFWELKMWKPATATHGSFVPTGDMPGVVPMGAGVNDY